MGSITEIRYEGQEESSTDSPRVKGSSPVRGKFFLLNLFALIQFWQICQNDLLWGKLECCKGPFALDDNDRDF